MVSCFIGIGSNLGDRNYYINSALKKIRSLPDSRLKKISTVIETAPEGYLLAPKYLNAVCEIDTGLLPYDLLKKLQDIEFSLGRVRPFKDAPRTIDLDILLYSDINMHEECLCIPHPRILERRFILESLNEIAPQALEKLLKKNKKVKAKTRPKITKKSKGKHKSK